MISLGALVLDANLQIPNLNAAPAVAGSERRTLGGRLVVQRLSPGGGELLLTAVLDGQRIYGYFTTSQVQSIRALADSGEEVTLLYNEQSIQVVVALDGVNLVPYGNRTDPPADHPHYGTVALIRR